MKFKPYFKKVRLSAFKIGIIFTLIILLTLYIFIEDFYGIAGKLQELFNEAFAGLEHIFEEDGTISPVRLILNNAQVCVLAFSLGVIPFLYLPAIVLVVNAVVIGVVLGIFAVESISDMLTTLVLGILPHGILELPAIFISIAIGFMLCKTINKTIRRRERDMEIWHAFSNGIKTLVFVCFPMIIAAGLIEVYITPKLLMMTL